MFLNIITKPFLTKIINAINIKTQLQMRIPISIPQMFVLMLSISLLVIKYYREYNYQKE